MQSSAGRILGLGTRVYYSSLTSTTHLKIGHGNSTPLAGQYLQLNYEAGLRILICRHHAGHQISRIAIWSSKGLIQGAPTTQPNKPQRSFVHAQQDKAALAAQGGPTQYVAIGFNVENVGLGVRVKVRVKGKSQGIPNIWVICPLLAMKKCTQVQCTRSNSCCISVRTNNQLTNTAIHWDFWQEVGCNTILDKYLFGSQFIFSLLLLSQEIYSGLDDFQWFHAVISLAL